MQLKKILLSFLVISTCYTHAQAGSWTWLCPLVRKHPYLVGALATTASILTVAWFFYTNASDSGSSPSADGKSVVPKEKEEEEGVGVFDAMDVLKNQCNGIHAIAVNNGGDLLALSQGKRVDILKKVNDNYQSIGQVEIVGAARAIAFHPQDTSVAIGATSNPVGDNKDTYLYIYNYETKKLETVGTPGRPHEDTIGFSGIAFSPDGTLLASVDDKGSMCFWNTKTLEIERFIEIPCESVNGANMPHYSLHVSFNSTGDYIAVGSSQSTRCCYVFEVETGDVKFKKQFQKYSKGDPDGDAAIVFHPTEPSIIAVSTSERWHAGISGKPGRSEKDPKELIEIIDIYSGDILRTIEGTRGASLMAFNQDGSMLACRNDSSQIAIYDLKSGSLCHRYLPDYREFYSAILFDKDNNCITGRQVMAEKPMLHIMKPNQLGGYSDHFQEVELSR